MLDPEIKVILSSTIPRQTKSNQYVKHIIMIPPNMIEKLGWNVGHKVVVSINGSTLVLR